MMLNEEGWSLLFILLGLLALLGAGFAGMGRERSMEHRLRVDGGALGTAAGIVLRSCGVVLLAVLPGTVYLFGLARMGMALSLMAGLIALLFFLLPRLRRVCPQARTLPQVFEGNKLARMALASVLLMSLMALAAGALSLLARVFASVFSLHYGIALAAAAAMGILLSLLCGTDAMRRMEWVQAFLTLFGLVAVPVTAALIGGRQDQALQTMLAGAFERMQSGRPLALDLLSDALWGVGALGLASLSQRVFSVRKERAARVGGRIGGAITALMVLLAAASGLVGRMVDDGLAGQTAAETVFLQAAGNEALAVPVQALLITAMVTALLLFFVDALRTAGSLSAWDIAQPLWGETRERPLLFSANAAAVLMGLAAFLLALNANVPLLRYACAGFLFAAVAGVCLLSRALGKKSGKGAWRGLAAGTIMAAVWLVLPWTREMDMIGVLPCAACALAAQWTAREGEAAL